MTIDQLAAREALRLAGHSLTELMAISEGEQETRQNELRGDAIVCALVSIAESLDRIAAWHEQ